MSTADITSSRPENFLDYEFSRFSPTAREAAKRDQLRSQPLLEHISKAHRINNGLGAIFRMLSANETRRCTFVPESDDGLEPPLSSYTVSSLLDLGALVSEMLVNEVERLADWADKYGILAEEGDGRG